MRNLIFVCTLVFLLTTLGVLVQAQNNTTNVTAEPDDTWYNSQWGGDSGGDSFTEPIPEPEPEPEETGMCSGTIGMSSLIVGSAMSLKLYRSKYGYETKE